MNEHRRSGTAAPGWRAALVAALLLAAAGAAPAAHLELRNGQRVEGTGLRVNAQGQYVIETAQGSRTYAPEQVLRAVPDQPAEWATALQAAQQRNFPEALRILDQIATRNRRLHWDEQAYLMMARIHMAQGKPDEAVQAFLRVPEAEREKPEIRPAYWKALFDAGQYGDLEPMLNKAVREGDRPTAARAQVLRGDIRRVRRLIEPAALDYLRAVVLFGDVRDVQPEALFKAGETLEDLRNARAAELFERLVKNYPDSEFAKRARER